MRRSISVFGLILSAAMFLPACSIVQSVQKCGFKGCPGDAEITAHVEQLLEQHPEFSPYTNLTVQTSDHVVYLYGLVNTEGNRRDAEALARSVPGVTRVVSSISLDNS